MPVKEHTVYILAVTIYNKVILCSTVRGGSGYLMLGAHAHEGNSTQLSVCLFCSVTNHVDLPFYFCQLELSKFDQSWMALHLAQTTSKLSAEYL